LHTFYHEFFHHLQTWIPEEDLVSISGEWKRAILAQDTQNLISTLYWGHYQRLKTQNDLLVLISTDNDLLKHWYEVTEYGIKEPTDADWIDVISRMQDSGKLPKDFLEEAGSPSGNVPAGRRRLPGGFDPRASVYGSFLLIVLCR
jgi:hypothetical protein